MRPSALSCLLLGASVAATEITFACPNACSGRGICSAGGCLCTHGWAGRSCDIDLVLSTPHSITSRPGQLVPVSALQQRDSVLACASSCSQQGGDCVAGVCMCREGFYGAMCQDKFCSNDCHNHGTCESGGVCRCDSGWSGLHCEFQLVQTSAGFNVAATGVRKLPSASGIATGLLAGIQANSQLMPLRGAQKRTSAASERAGRLLKSVQLMVQNHRRQQTAAQAAMKIQRALAAARSHVATLPGHEFTKLEDVEGGSEPALHLQAASFGQVNTFKHSDGNAALCGIAGCGDHGTCNQTTKQCECKQGWVGEHCDIVPCQDDCNGNGICMSNRCICDENFYGDGCEHKRCPSDCSGHGYCFSGRCQCSGDFGGDACDEPAHSAAVLTLKLPKKGTPAKGSPALALSTLRAQPRALTAGCAGDASDCSGHGACDALGECTCDESYFGSSCANFCPDSCSGHGECLKGSCLCAAGWSGPSCSVEGACSGNGLVDQVIDACMCDPGWSGDLCEVQVVCPDPFCSGHGACQSSGECMCGAGWGGLSCEISSPQCENLCGAYGACNAASNMCECSDGWSGPHCTIEPKTCPDNCNGHGTCIEGFCSCDPAYTGDACDAKSGTGALMLPVTDCANASLLLLQDGPCTSPVVLTEEASQTKAEVEAVEARLAMNRMRLKTLGPSTASWLPSALPTEKKHETASSFKPAPAAAHETASSQPSLQAAPAALAVSATRVDADPVAVEGDKPLRAAASVRETLQQAMGGRSSSPMSLIGNIFGGSTAEAAASGVKANLAYFSRDSMPILTQEIPEQPQPFQYDFFPAQKPANAN